MSIIYIGQFSRTHEAEDEIQRRHPNKAIISQVGASKSLVGAKKKAKRLEQEGSGQAFPIYIAHATNRDKFYVYT